MIDLKQLVSFVIRPTLEHIGLGGTGAEELVLGTILQESGARYLHQLGSGIAAGIGEMEKATHDDIIGRALQKNQSLLSKVMSLVIPGIPAFDQLPGNLYYSVAMVRLKYYSCKDPLPASGDVSSQAAFYKRVYNTSSGAASIGQYISNWEAAMVGHPFG